MSAMAWPISAPALVAFGAREAKEKEREKEKDLRALLGGGPPHPVKVDARCHHVLPHAHCIRTLNVHLRLSVESRCGVSLMRIQVSMANPRTSET